MMLRNKGLFRGGDILKKNEPGPEGEKDITTGLIKTNPSQNIKKVACPVIFLTEKYKISGKVHVTVNIRHNDFLLSCSEFIPITDAVIYHIDEDKELYRTDFVALKKTMINLAMEKARGCE